jgi:heme-degrading monooxygenase HmoA
MFTCVVELIIESGKAKELANTINEKVVPILKKQGGFVDETVLVSDTEPTRVLGLSFWDSKEDADRYHQEQYPKIHEMLKHLLETEPNIRTFDVQYHILGTPRVNCCEMSESCRDSGKVQCLQIGSSRDMMNLFTLLICEDRREECSSVSKADPNVQRS